MSDIEGSNFNETSTFIDSPEFNLGSSDQFIGNFLEKPGDLNHVVKNKIWVTSDTHFGHKNILVYEAAARPFKDKEEMNEVLIQRWNEKVGPNDVVIHLGDFAFATPNKIRQITARLNGRKFLLLGNHDRVRKFDWGNLGFEQVFRHSFMLDDKFIFSHEPLDRIPDGKINVYGHVHGSSYFNTLDRNRICVCVERWNCAPIEYIFIQNLFRPTSPAIIET
jgi:calcineurin-like phosphoesterase family protein